MASKLRSNKDLVWVRWEGNKSPRYDGKVEGVPESSIVKRSGQNVEVQWGKKVWYGVIESPPEPVKNKKPSL